MKTTHLHIMIAVMIGMIVVSDWEWSYAEVVCKPHNGIEELHVYPTSNFVQCRDGVVLNIDQEVVPNGDITN